jgi:hypothetical protein
MSKLDFLLRPLGLDRQTQDDKKKKEALKQFSDERKGK